MSADEALVRAANGLAADPVVATVAHLLSSPWVLVLVALALLLDRARIGQWRGWLAVALAVGLADFTTSTVLKPLVDRPRPCRTLDALVKVDPCGVGASFPSAHAANGFALATAATPLVARGGPLLLGIAAAVAASRIVLGVHYPSDVVAGALWGTALGWLARRWVRRTSPTPPPSPSNDPPSSSAPGSPPP